MDKLLHERLRDYAADWYEARPLRINGKTFDTLLVAEVLDLADEIERSYIPRPRFEDGEPVQFRDEVEECSGPVTRMLFFADGSGYLCGKNDAIYAGFPFGIESTPKRRVPKVLDVGGVACEREQKVWRLSDGEWFYVEEVKPNGKLNLKQGGLSTRPWTSPSCTPSWTN